MSKNRVALSEYYKLYELALSYEGKSPKTLIVYFSDMNRFLRFLKAKLEREPVLADLEPILIQHLSIDDQTASKLNKPDVVLGVLLIAGLQLATAIVP